MSKELFLNVKILEIKYNNFKFLEILKNIKIHHEAMIKVCGYSV